MVEPPRPITLAGDRVTLEPISITQAAEYFLIGQDPEIWRFLAPDAFRTVSDAEHWIETMLARQEQTGSVTFSIYDNTAGRLAGSSSYLDVRVAHAGIEIGYTWYGREFQRTYVNTATKLVLLEHAFQTLGANRVQLQTDARNERSQKAILRLGAVREGILRQHKLYPNGVVRNSAMFSITRDEWPTVRANLEGMLSR